MKFEFDHKSGTMKPKKDEDIYFAKSQGGGLIVDDKKHNIKFIIERDEVITKLFGSFDKDNLNLYDMRDARIIADRVVRLFGRDHKYSDFHYFLKGYKVQEDYIKSCSDFLDESVWSDIHKRSNGEVRKEEGIVIGSLEDGTKLILPTEALSSGTLVDFDDSKIFTILENDDCPIYIAVIAGDHYKDTYYRYDPDTEEKINMVECITADSDLRNNDFGSLRAIIKNKSWYESDLDGIEVDVTNDCDKYSGNGNGDYKVYTDHDKAYDDAVESEKDLLEGQIDRGLFKRFYNLFGGGFLNVKDIEDAMRESYEYYYDDLNEEDAIEQLLVYNVINDDADFFYVDEDGNTDHSQPSFDYTIYRDKYVDAVIDNIGDVVDEYISQYGYDGIVDYIDYNQLAKNIIDSDGVGSCLAGYDGVEREEYIDGTTYYIYRIS